MFYGTFASLPSTVPEGLGEVAEWLKAHAWKACLPERVTRVRIPVSPQIKEASFTGRLFFFT